MPRAESVQSYSRTLAQALRMRGMREDEIERVVSDVLASQTEDPVEEFGPAHDYAERFEIASPRERGGRLWWWGFGAGLAWAVVSSTLLLLGQWVTPTPALVVGAPIVVLTLLGGVVSAIATSWRRRWQ